MSRVNLIDPNGYLEIADIWFVGQTITLNVTTDIYNFCFENWLGTDRNDLHCNVYLTDEDHHPTGSPIASSKTFVARWEPDRRRVRNRFTFMGFTMEAGVEYFFLIYDHSPTWHINTRIYTRKGDNSFPDGMLYYSDDAGETWTEYPNDDMVFAVTGIPEQPPQPPNPPIKNFAILDLVQFRTETGIKIIVTTNVPCHLYCYWTATEPEKHLIPFLTRGTEMHTRLKMCFVNWHENEQDEPFDTLTHTFTKEPWAYCETRWLTFRATVMKEWVKSVGPIFKKHRGYIEPPPAPEFEKYWDEHDSKGAINWTFKSAQTFTPQLNYSCSQITQHLSCEANPGPARVEIRSTNPDGSPTEVVLATGYVPQAGIPIFPEHGPVLFTLDAPFDALTDVLYAIVFYAPSQTIYDYYWVYGYALYDPYPRGNRWVRTYDAGEWSKYDAGDWHFITWGTALS